mmetsp:Transcript_3834/g.10065  ORF Transcript_3834/g.10065 Transcript_3834/m.10065 type:complete len:93 (-) Transcript_3834:179-457(-)
MFFEKAVAPTVNFRKKETEVRKHQFNRTLNGDNTGKEPTHSENGHIQRYFMVHFAKRCRASSFGCRTLLPLPCALKLVSVIIAIDRPCLSIP